MLAQARPLWSALPEGALQMQLLSELAAKANLPLADLTTLWNVGGGGSRGNAPRGAGRQRPGSDHGEYGDPGNASDGGYSPSASRDEHGGGYGGGGGGGQGRPRTFDGAPRQFKGRFAARDREAAERVAQLRVPRRAPRTPATQTVQMLFGHPEFWEQLSMDEHELLHALPAPYGTLIAWLERDQSEHGPRPWAVLSHALRADPTLDDEALQAADGDADPDATFAEFRRAVDLLLDKQLKAQADRLAREATTPDAMARYMKVFEHWKEVKLRLSKVHSEDDSEV
jgi:DNA primase